MQGVTQHALQFCSGDGLVLPSYLSRLTIQCWATLPTALHKCFQPLAQQLQRLLSDNKSISSHMLQKPLHVFFRPKTQHPAAPTLCTQSSPALGSQHIWNPYHHPGLLALVSVCTHNGKCCWKGTLHNLKYLQITVFRPRKAFVPGIIFPREQFHRSRGQAAQRINP